MNVDKTLCKEVGVSSAMVYSVIKSQLSERGVPFEGHQFVRLSVKDIAKELPFYSSRTIVRAINKLQEKDMLICKQFVGTTRWWRLNV